MKKTLLFLSVGMATFLAQSASAQATLVDSWENSAEGWGMISANWTSGGYSTTTGVTQGTYSWILNAGTNPDYGGAIGGTASTALTALLANAASVSVDVYASGGFGGYLQFDLTLNGGGLGYTSVDGYGYSQSANLGGEKTLTFTIPSAMRTTLAANLGTATSLNYQIGGGGGGTIYLDNLTITAVPEPSTLALAGVAAAGLLSIRRRKA